VEGIYDVITHVRFGDNLLRGCGLRGQSSAFPIDFAGHLYNTLTLPLSVWSFSA